MSEIKLMMLKILFYLIFPLSVYAQTLQKHTFSRSKMGSPFTIIVHADDSLKLATVINIAYARVDSLNHIFSDYDPLSEINILCKSYKKGEWHSVSKDLYDIVNQSLKASNASNGAFDITVGNIVQLWRKARKEKRKPDKLSLKFALKKTGFKHLELDEKTQKIRFNTEGVRLDFGGIVKGYAAQEVVRILTEAGYPFCLADAGGDLAIGKSYQQKWMVGVSIPNENNALLPKFLTLENQAVATSGDMYNFVEFDGKRYSHIVNPKTGLGVTHQRNVTIIAPAGALADWLATACSVLPVKKALKLIKKYPQTELLIIENNNNNLKMWQSEGFSEYYSSN